MMQSDMGVHRQPSTVIFTLPTLLKLKAIYEEYNSLSPMGISIRNQKNQF